jgi:hypothetical protein
MAFDVSALTAYVDQTSTDLLVAAQFEAETASMIGLQTGIKSAAALQLLSTNAVMQDGSSCGFNASGDVTFTQRTLTTAAIKFQDTLCPRTLESKWTQLLLKKGQNYTEADIPKLIVDNILGGIKQRLEVADWQGDTTSGSAYLSRYDGLIKIINAASPVTATASTYNATNARTIVANIVSNIPATLKGNAAVKIFMGYDAAEIYRQKLMNDNLFHVPVGSGDQKGIMAEGSVHEIVPVHGLDGLYSVSGQSCIFAFNPDNAVLGVDMENEEEQAKMWYSLDDDNVKYSFRFRRGVQIAYGDEIVVYANS